MLWNTFQSGCSDSDSHHKTRRLVSPHPRWLSLWSVFCILHTVLNTTWYFIEITVAWISFPQDDGWSWTIFHMCLGWFDILCDYLVPFWVLDPELQEPGIPTHLAQELLNVIQMASSSDNLFKTMHYSICRKCIQFVYKHHQEWWGLGKSFWSFLIVNLVKELGQ